MCGICGILQWGSPAAEHRSRVAAMSEALAHRGPDDRGEFADADVCLGFRRLAVIDLETGQQPIRLEDDRAVIVLNGEIYNFRELRRELESRHRFHSKGDVEVVLRLYAELGIDCLRRLNGMFALAIWDRQRRKLFLARDRFGIKPLFLCREGPRTAFASEVGALIAGGFPASPEIDPLQLRHYLAQGYPAPDGSILRGVRALPPGTVLEIDERGERLTPFWKPPTQAPPEIRSEQEAAEELEARLEQAVRRQRVADVPVGLFLSGGLDSGTLATLLRRVEHGALSTFSVGFSGPGSVSELPSALAVARRLGTDHHELPMNPVRVAGDLPAILAAQDGPLADATMIPTWYVSRFARDRVVVALSGEGADELFGGYARHRYDHWLGRVGWMGGAALAAALHLAGRAPSERLRRRLEMPPGLERQLDWSRVFTAAEIEELVERDLPGEDALLARHEGLDARWERLARIDALNARLLADRELFLPGDLLTKVDRMSMAHSLEVRVPYLDNEVAELVLPLPGRFKIRGRTDKLLLRRVSERLLPGGVAGRRKLGFDVPIAAWLRGPLRETMAELLDRPGMERRGWLRHRVVSRWIGEHLEGRVDHGRRLWSLMALEGWLRLVLDRAGARAA